MVADFCSLVSSFIIIILLREITISSMWLTDIPIFQYVIIHFHIQRFNFIVIELRFFKNMDKIWKALLRCLTSQINQFLFHGYILHLDIIKSDITFKVKVKIGFQWGYASYYCTV